MTRRFVLSRFAAVAAFSVISSPLWAQVYVGAADVYAITNARIVTVSGKPIEKGTVVVRDGLIVSVSEKADVPADARVLDGTGLTVYPGLIDGYTRLGMPAPADYALPATARGDAYRLGTIRAEYTAVSLMKPDPAAFGSWHRAGFTSALAAPYVGILSGTSAVVSLGNDDDPAGLALRSNVAMHLNFAAPEPTPGYPGALMGEIAAARQAFYDAQNEAIRHDAYDRDPVGRARPANTRALAALRPVLDKKMPLVIRANSASEIRRALKMAQEFGVRPIIEGGTEAYAVASELKKAGAAVLLSADLPDAPRIPAGEEDPSTLQGLRRRALAPTSAKALLGAGVPFALTSSGLTTPAEFARNVRRIEAAGLSADDAVLAVTLSPARLLGVDKQIGSVEPGKVANLTVVENGPLFETRSRIKYLFVDGKRVRLDVPETGAATAGVTPGGRRGGAGNLLGQLPPGVTPDQARQFLAQNPQAARPFLPPGVTPEQALASLNGEEGQGGQTPGTAQTERPATPPPPVGTGLIPPLPAPVASSFVLRGATVWTSGPQGVLQNADVYVRDGKIAQIGTGLSVPSGTTEVDARGKHVTPGMIDCHSHTAIEGGVNEGSNIVTAEVRIEDVIDPDDVNIYRQLAGGTTAANMLHGSANAIGGQNAVVKWRWGATADEMLLKGAPPGVKFALGENPTRSNGGIPTTGTRRYPATRMGVERVLRDSFTRARDYKQKQADYKAGKIKDAPRRDLQLDAIVEILDGKRLVHCHSYRQDEILMLIRLAEEFGFKVATFQHVLEGYKVADEIAKHGAGGSTFSDWWTFKIEAIDAIPYNGALMTERGVVTSFNSDSSELARRLNQEAAKAVKYGGMKPEEALKLVTINPAKQLRVDKMTGSLETGKDADIVVWSSDPLSTVSVCEKTFVDGKLLFDRAADLAARPALDEEKKRLAQALNQTQTPRPGFGRRGAVSAAGTPQTAGTPSGTQAANAVPPPDTKTPLATNTATPQSIIPAFAGGGDVLIVNGTVHPVSGPEIAGASVLVQNGKITQIIPAGQTASAPADTPRFDASGLHVYPGLMDADTTLGVDEIGSRRETQDYRELGEFNPELKAAVAVNPDVETIRVARSAGILNAIVSPAGGTISGMGALLRLDGWTWEDLAENPTASMVVNFPTLGVRRFREAAHRCEEAAGNNEEAWNEPLFRSGAFVPAGSHDADALRFGLLPDQDPTPAPQQAPAQAPEQNPTPTQQTPQTPPAVRVPSNQTPGANAGDRTSANPAPSGDAVLRPLNDFLDDARRYRDARRAEEKGAPVHPRDSRFEAIMPVLEGRVPLVLRADRARDIRAAVAWAKRENFRIVLVGGQEADQCADLLARENVPVVLGPVMNLPARFDLPYDDSYTLPARLAKAGVRVCLSSGSSADVRWLPQHAAMARAFGLPADEALKAVTLYPAQFFGMGDRLGSIEPGKEANLIVTTGDPLEMTTMVKAAFVAGRPVDLSNKQTRLFDKYRARPRK